MFTTSNNSFGPTEISYLENRFCNLALKANRYEVKNGNDPTPGNITEEKECELEEFIDYAKVIMGVLGHKLFEPVTLSTEEKTDSTDDKKNSPLQFYLKRTVKNVGLVEARGRQTEEGFVVLAGSHISKEDDNTISKTLKEERKHAPLDANGNLLEDVLFSSPSTAASFVIGKSANGLVYWKDENGNTLKSLETRE